MINLSGAIGITKLKRKINGQEKKIYVFSDNHNKDKYCEDEFSSGLNIKNYLEEKMHGNQVLLEEVKRSKSQKLKELWAQNKHTVALKNLYLNNTQKITPIDIRQYLFIVSWEILKKDDKLDKEINLNTYLKNFDKFFELKEVIPSLEVKLKKIKFKKTGICKYFKRLKHDYQMIKEPIDLNQKVVDVIETNPGFLRQIDDVASKIMDWYTIICIFTTDKPTYLHAGLYHTSNIIDILINEFEFEKYYDNGDTSIDSISDTDSCVKFNE